MNVQRQIAGLPYVAVFGVVNGNACVAVGRIPHHTNPVIVNSPQKDVIGMSFFPVEWELSLNGESNTYPYGNWIVIEEDTLLKKWVYQEFKEKK